MTAFLSFIRERWRCMVLSFPAEACRELTSLVFRVTRMATLPGALLPVRPRRCMLRISDGTGS